MSPVVATVGPITPEQFLELPDRDRYELVGGELVELPVMSLEGSAVASRIVIRLGAHVEAQQLGLIFTSDASYQCFPEDPGQVRRPDVSFVARGRLTRDSYEHGHCRIAPDLAVEVVSPGDSSSEMGDKIEQYLNAGVQLVWVIYPSSRTADEYRLDGQLAHVRLGGTLSAEPVLSGLQIPLQEIFPDPETVL